MIRMKTKEHLRKPQENKGEGGSPPCFPYVFLGFDPNHPSFHAGSGQHCDLYWFVVGIPGLS